MIFMIYMTDHIANTIGKPQAEIIAYFKGQHFDLDQVLEFEQECEKEADECECNITSLGYGYYDEVGYYTYGSKAKDNYADEQEERANDLRDLAGIAGEYYDELAA